MFPLFFSCKRKGKAKRKLPADVRKLKNGCAVRGERTRRARLESAIQSVIPLRAPRPIHPGSNIFSPHSSLSVIFLTAFSHRPDGFALRSCRALMRHPGIPAGVLAKYIPLTPLSGPRITCGVTQKKRCRCYRAEAVAGCAIVGTTELAALRHSSPSILL